MDVVKIIYIVIMCVFCLLSLIQFILLKLGKKQGADNVRTVESMFKWVVSNIMIAEGVGGTADEKYQYVRSKLKEFCDDNGVVYEEQYAKNLIEMLVTLTKLVNSDKTIGGQNG